MNSTRWALIAAPLAAAAVLAVLIGTPLGDAVQPLAFLWRD